jgi:DNA polymerase III epsilon subunit-like protein
MTGSSIPWQQASLAALDLEGSGAQDREDEAILEIAVVPITGGQPDMASAYCTLVNPQRAVPWRPWISPGLTTSALAGAPTITDIEPELARRLDAAFIVGHNVGVDWRLLHCRCPSIHPAGLIDTLRLARLAYPGEKGNNLAKLLDRHQLTHAVTQLAKNSQPHRALWDTIGAIMLLHPLAAVQFSNGSIDDLLSAASIDMGSDTSPKTEKAVQGELFS